MMVGSWKTAFLLSLGNFSGGRAVQLSGGCRHPSTCCGLVVNGTPKKKRLLTWGKRLLGVPTSHRKTPMNVEDFGWILDVSAVHGIGLHSTLTPNFLFTTLTSIHIPPKPKGFIKKCPSTTIISESCSNVIGSMGLGYKTYSYHKNQPGTKVNMLVPWIPWPNHESWIMQQRHPRLLMEKTKNPAAAALENDQYLSIFHSCSN